MDIDPRHSGDESLVALVQEHGELPATVEAITGGGGRHIIFAHPGDGTKITRSSVGLGIDVKSDGGYIVAPPSVHISGGQYRWWQDHGPHETQPAALPNWLHEMLVPAPRSESTERGGRSAAGDELNRLVQSAGKYVARAASASKGARNNAAFSLAGHVAAFRAEPGGQQLTQAQVLDLLRPWNHGNEPPLSERELQQVVASAMSNGKARQPHIVHVRPPAATDKTDKRASVGSVGTPKAQSPEFWPAPQPLPNELPEVLPFDASLLPNSLRPWVLDVAERMQCPADFPAVAAMIAVATVVGRKVGIRPKQYDDWLVVPNLYAAVIGPPSVMKTPAIQEPLRPLKRLEIEAKEQFDREIAEYAATQLVAEQRRQKAKQDIKKALEHGGDAKSIAAVALKQDEGQPVRRRFIVNDSTVEKLGVTLNENPNGVLCFRDELIGLLKALEREGQEGARAFYLEAWNGTGRYTYDRIGRGTVDIDAATVSVLGSIQPGPLRPISRPPWPTQKALMA